MKTYKDNTLKNWSKKDLIDHIRCLEYNYGIVEAKYNDSVNLNTKLVKLLNKNKIEWLKVNNIGTFEVIDCEENS